MGSPSVETPPTGLAGLDAARAHDLDADHNEVLSLIARGAPLAESLDTLARLLERRSPGLLASILLLDPDGVHLRHGAAPSLPAAYNAVVDGAAIGEGQGSCGTAAWRRAQVIVEDIGVDPLWAAYRDLALSHGLRACWSTPILGREGAVLGTFALYYRQARSPSAADLALIRRCTDLVSVAIERDRQDAALRQSQVHLRGLIDSVDGIVWEADPTTFRFTFVSPRAERLLGYPVARWQDDATFWVDHLHPDDREGAVSFCVRSTREGRDHTFEYRMLAADGRVVWLRDIVTVVVEEGRPTRLRGIMVDVTETRRLEEQLRHAQKMEAIGHLAGGIAHDFNNILTTVMLQADASRLPADTPPAVGACLGEIREAAERAANLTRQLLLFARRQVMQVRQVDLCYVVQNLAKMLQRLLGDDVRLQLLVHPDPLPVRADAGMLEQVLMNLAVNARDAMPRGGQLFVGTGETILDDEEARLHADAAPGRYARLAVRDTGTGIPADVLPHIFEPFFSTKEPGRGTGLGLATVYAIVKQHRGWVEVDTAPGLGSTFRVFLPVDVEGAGPAGALASARTEPRGGAETILLVEDEPGLRELLRRVLEPRGYRILEAASGAEALQVWESHEKLARAPLPREARSAPQAPEMGEGPRDTRGPRSSLLERGGGIHSRGEGGAAPRGKTSPTKIALLLTDVAMPGGMNGQQLARRLAAAQPGLKVLYSSGYSAEVGGRPLELGAGERFLSKPFTPDQLLDAVRRCLDA